MKNKTLRTVFGAAFLLALAGMGYGLYRYFEPVAGLDELKTDIRLTDETLLSDFELDPVQADRKFQNKVLEISGTVIRVEPDSNRTRIIFDRQGKFIVVASCPEISGKLSDIKQNQSITVKGVYTGYVIIDDLFMIPGEIKIDPCQLVP